MWLRRAFYWIQLLAIVAVPGWIVVARSIAPTGLGAQDVLVFLAWPALALAMMVVLGLTWARKAVRTTRVLSWVDVASLSVWYLVAIAYGVFVSLSSELGAGLTGGLLILATIGAISMAVWQLVRAARRRVQTVLAGFDRSAISVGEYRASPAADGDVLRVTPRKR